MSTRNLWLGQILCCLLVLAVGSAQATLLAVDDDETNEAAQEALEAIQDLVGEWEGSGKSDASKGWDEEIQCTWQFNKEGFPSLAVDFRGKDGATNGLLGKGIFSFDLKRKALLLQAEKADGSGKLEFSGKAKSASNFVFERINKAANEKDSLDQLDIKILNDGDRLVYAFKKRIGKSKSFKQYAQVGLNRKGTSMAAAGASGPKCIVTGGLAAIPVTYNGQSYYVCCTGCRDAFNANPEKFIARAEKK